ncbi:MAG: hypothetical protein ACI3XM_03530, partial [Eubacteriales bacterium]
MSKKITSLFLALIMVLGMTLTAFPVSAAEETTGTLVITADKTRAKSGETIEYSVIIGPVINLDCVEFQMAIPDGLTYVPESGTIPDGLADKLGKNTQAAFNDTEIRVVIGSIDGYTSTEDTLLCTFACTVDDDFSGTAVMDFVYDEDFIFDNTDLEEIEMTVTTASVILNCAHSYEVDVKEPTCKEGGYSTYTCTICGDKYTGDETDALGHDLDEGVVTTEPTCEEVGTKTYTCHRCEETQTEEIPATGHNFEWVVDKEATYEEA